MAKLYGELVGVAYSGASATVQATSSAHEKGTDHILIRDRIELAAAAINDTISLGKFGSNAMLDPLGCQIYFDDLGTSVTMNVGIATDDDALVATQDVASAAGNFSLFKSVDIANWFKPLWQVVGLSADPGGQIELLATVKGAAATGTVVWSFKGQNR